MNVTPKQEAADPNTPPDRLEKCQFNSQHGEICAASSSQFNIELTRIVASNPNATFKLLEELVNTNDIITLQNIAANLNTPSEILHKLANLPLNSLIEDLEQIWEKFTNHFRYHPDEFEIFNRPISYIHWNFYLQLESVELEKSVILKLKEAYKIYRLVARNPNIFPADLVKLGGIFIEDFLENPVLPLLILEDPDFINKEESSFPKQVAIARYSKTPVNILEYLMIYGFKPVRDYIAANPNTPVEFLETMAEDAIVSTHLDLSIHIAIAKNTKTPAYLLEKLVIYMDNLSYIEESMEIQKAWLAKAIADNLNTPKKVLKHLADSKSIGKNLIFRALVSNPNTPADIREQIIN